MREGLLAASLAIGLHMMIEPVDAEVTDVADPKGRHDPKRRAYRHGSDDGKVTLGAAHPGAPSRLPSTDGTEVHLESYDTFASVDLLADHMVASMLARLSGRLRGRPGAGGRGGGGSGVGDFAVQRQPAVCRRHRQRLASAAPGPSTTSAF